MNIFIMILLSFSMVGLIDKIQGNRWKLAQEFDKGLSAMGSLAISISGIYCVGITLVRTYAGTISGWTEGMLVDPSIVIGCLLAPDLGAPFLTAELSSNPNLGYFSGVVVAGCLGQFTSFQLPVLFSALEEKEKGPMMKGFLHGIFAIPIGLLAGGVLLGLPVKEILINISLISVVCFVLAMAFMKFSSIVEKTMITFGKFIGYGSQLMFAIVVVGLFIPGWKVVDDVLVHEILTILIKMVVIICGGLVLANLCLRYLKRQLSWVAEKMNTNDFAIMGLLLNSINSLVIVALIPKMDKRGKRMNAAFAVSGAYLLGGQMVFVLSIGNSRVFYAYFFSKLIAGIASIIISMGVNRRNRSLPKKSA
ncbi:ethanolamine utilization protein EutH [Sinanaerobacter chloroacetimidivorans]|uniref:Ethanolamine utilization protein EutH n=1 Tax=Sinanaerobacter chloroacetimidivorans TaxID=2818044 RepID=A0A8J7W574_9FIRM|nr:ethanolamine utilization protein EutH [Sinanaerobacter chloroacetimidivorans]MBR0600501.1 ethanolamine utilization protein EutH [Sinanaerobacter chloroacetimidivorans]